MSKKNLEITIQAICLTLILIYICSKGIIEVPDSEGYLTSHIIRTPVYPLFLKFLTHIVGYKSILWVVIQSSFGLCSAFYLCKQLKEIFNLNNVLVYTLYIICISPYLYLHYVGNTIATEALAYPLYLLITTYLLQFIFHKKQKYIYITLSLWFLLLLTRAQFLYFTPIFITLFLYNYLNNKKTRLLVINIIICITIPICTSTIDKAYHFIQHDHYVSTPWTGLQISTLPFFVCSQKDSIHLNSDLEKEYFNLIYNDLKSQGLNIHHLPDQIDATNQTDYYIKHYCYISNRTISDKGLLFFKEKGYSRDECFIEVDKITKSLAVQLLAKNLKSWIKTYTENIAHGFGTKLTTLLWIFILSTSLAQIIKSKHNKKRKTYYLFISIMCISLILNIATVAIAEHTIKRFLFYNNWLIFFILGSLILKKGYHEH